MVDRDRSEAVRNDDAVSDEYGPAPWAGVVFAGGGSRRFGEAVKLLAELDGTPLVRRVADRLAARTDRLAVATRPGKRARLRDLLAGLPADVTVITDPEPDRRPLAGIAAGLGEVSEDQEYGAFVAGDMPFADPALLDHLSTTA